MLIGILGGTNSTVNAQIAANNFTVMAGFGDYDKNGLEIEEFLPEDVTIQVGDSITWTFSSLEIHTVTFLSGADRIPDLMPLPMADWHSTRTPLSPAAALSTTVVGF